MSAYLTQALRQQLLDADGQRCAYCQTTTENTGYPMTVDHIIPTALGGETEFANLCFCCRMCNQFKGRQVNAIDPLTAQTMDLFHPRTQHWADHFSWDETGTLIQGHTATGRATIIALNMNNPTIVPARRRWVSVGWHLPS